MEPSVGRWYRDRAALLLRQLLREPGFSAERLAAELATTTARVEAYRSGRARMPLERQLYLAVLAMARVPKLARAGGRLRDHIQALVRCAAPSNTVVHADPPANWGWFGPRLTRGGVPFRPPGKV